MVQPLNVIYESTRSVYTANQWLHKLNQQQLIACDFETASNYTLEQQAAMKLELADNPTQKRRVYLESIIAATALSHPYHTQLTHCSIATSPTDAYVFILDNKRITNRVLNFLVTTQARQIWHNASFDFKHIYYHTNRFPQNYEDTQQFAKAILNHVETYKAKTRLKELAGHWYGSWGISADHFTIDQMYDETVLKYAATDACATFRLYQSILKHCKDLS